VDRYDVLEGGLRAFKRSTFNPKALLSVKFSAEDGVDNGGPTKEFLTLALKEIQQMSIFEGEQNNKLLAMDYNGM